MRIVIQGLFGVDWIITNNNTVGPSNTSIYAILWKILSKLLFWNFLIRDLYKWAYWRYPINGSYRLYDCIRRFNHIITNNNTVGLFVQSIYAILWKIPFKFLFWNFLFRDLWIWGVWEISRNEWDIDIWVLQGICVFVYLCICVFVYLCICVFVYLCIFK